MVVVGVAVAVVVGVSGLAGVVAAKRAPKWFAGDVGTWEQRLWVRQLVPVVGRTVGEVAAWVDSASLVDQVVDGGRAAVVAAAAVEPESEASALGVERSFVAAPPVAVGRDGGACAAGSSDVGRTSEQESDAPGVGRAQRSLGDCSHRDRIAAAAVEHGKVSAAADELVPEAGIGSVVVVAVVRTELGSGHRSCCASKDVVRDERQVNAELFGDVAAAAVVAVDVAVGDNNGLLAAEWVGLVGQRQSIPEQVAALIADTADGPVAAVVDDAFAAVVAAVVVDDDVVVVVAAAVVVDDVVVDDVVVDADTACAGTD